MKYEKSQRLREKTFTTCAFVSVCFCVIVIARNFDGILSEAFQLEFVVHPRKLEEALAGLKKKNK